MQHTNVLELNTCIAFLRTGLDVDMAHGLDLTWTFRAPRDPSVQELWIGSPLGEDAWGPTLSEVKADQQKRARDEEIMNEHRAASQAAALAAQSRTTAEIADKSTPVAALVSRPIEFKRRQVGGGVRVSAVSGLTQDLVRLKKSGGAVVGVAEKNGNVPNVMLVIYLPNRKPVELRVAKTATVEQALGALMERAKDQLRKKNDRYEMRMHDSDGLPDDDFPALDRSSVLSDMGSSEFCVCEIEGDSDDEVVVAPSPAATPIIIPTTPSAPPQLNSAQTPQRAKSIGDPNIFKIIFLDGTSHYKRVDPEDSRAGVFLKKIVKTFPLFAEEYHFTVLDEDKERLCMITGAVDVNDDVLQLGVDTLVLRRRRFADAPPDVDADALKVTLGKEASKRAMRKKTIDEADGVTAAAAQAAVAVVATGEGGGVEKVVRRLPVPGKFSVDNFGDFVKKQSTATNAGGGNIAGGGGTDVSELAPKLKQTKIKGGQTQTPISVDPESILLNEIKAAVYEEWYVTKTNNWGKNQKRIMGVDLQKIYNKPRDPHGGFGQSVKHAERMISDVLTIDLNPNNPAAFTIKFRDGPGNAVVVLNYEAEDGGDEAAKIVAKIKYIQNGKLNLRAGF